MRELNQYPSRVIARVRAGETVDITDRGRVVARLTPVAPADTILEELVRARQATPATITRPFDEPRDGGDPSAALTSPARVLRRERIAPALLKLGWR